MLLCYVVFGNVHCGIGCLPDGDRETDGTAVILTGAVPRQVIWQVGDSRQTDRKLATLFHLKEK